MSEVYEGYPNAPLSYYRVVDVDMREGLKNSLQKAIFEGERYHYLVDLGLIDRGDVSTITELDKSHHVNFILRDGSINFALLYHENPLVSKLVLKMLSRAIEVADVQVERFAECSTFEGSNGSSKRIKVYFDGKWFPVTQIFVAEGTLSFLLEGCSEIYAIDDLTPKSQQEVSEYSLKELRDSASKILQKYGLTLSQLHSHKLIANYDTKEALEMALKLLAGESIDSKSTYYDAANALKSKLMLIEDHDDRVTVIEYLRLSFVAPTGSAETITDNQLKTYQFLNNLFSACIKKEDEERARNALLTSIKAREPIQTGKTKLYFGSQQNLDSRKEFALVHEEMELFHYWLDRVFVDDSDSAVYKVNPLLNDELNSAILQQQDTQKKSHLVNVKRAIALVIQSYYEVMDKIIDANAFESLRVAMIDLLNKKPDGTNRQSVFVALNGHTGSGKGTTIQKLGAKVSETGTDGILGRGSGFEGYEWIARTLDLPRGAQELMPSKFMALLLMIDIINKRIALDNDGKFDEPVYVSGFPRSKEQAGLFKGLRDICSISLEISSEVAVYRTIRRLFGKVLKGETPREDDCNDIQKKDEQSYAINKMSLITEIREFITANNIEKEEDAKINEFAKKYTLALNARYFSYDRAKSSINGAIRSLTGAGTQVVQCDNLLPDEVFTRVRAILYRQVEA